MHPRTRVPRRAPLNLPSLVSRPHIHATTRLREVRRPRPGHHGALAVVPAALGLRRRVDAGGARQGAGVPLPARRRRRAQRRRPARRARLLRPAPHHRHRAPLARQRRERDRPRWLLRPAPGTRLAPTPVCRRAPGPRSRRREPERHALALRRAGLHGIGDARRQVDAGRVAQPIPGGRGDVRGVQHACE
jgi:hypothetical protein